MIDVDIRPVVDALGLPVKRDGQDDYIRCPKTIHENDDTRPRCGIKGKTFNCLKCGATGDAVTLVRLINGSDAKEAILFIESTLGLTSTPQAPVDAVTQWARIRCLSRETLKKLDVKGVGGEVHFPMRDADGKVVGHSRRRSNNQAFTKGDKALSNAGGKNGLFYVSPLPKNDFVAVVEGAPDTAALIDAGHDSTIGTPGAKISRAALADLQRLCANQNVVLFPDPDQAGTDWRERIGAALRAEQANVSFVPPTDQDIDKRL